MRAPSPADGREASATRVTERGMATRLAYGMTRLESGREKNKNLSPRHGVNIVYIP